MKAMKMTAAMVLAVASAATAWASGTINVRGLEYNVDTVFHAKVGPGTTQTSLELRCGQYPLNVFYLTVDKTVPGVSIRALSAGDKVAGTARTSSMAESHSGNGVLYFAGTNADFFWTSGTSTNGKSTVGTPTASTTVEREIYKTSNSNYQFSVDTAGVARICRLNYYTGTATLGDKVTLFKGVNVASPNNGVTVYTPRYFGSANGTDYAGACNQVTAVLAPGSKPFTAGGTFSLQVTSLPTTDGDLAVPDGGFVIHGRGTSTSGCNTGAKGFVGSLKPGDIVEFDNIILTPGGERIFPRTIVSGNPKNVGEGLTLDTESERGDACDRHPRTSIGVSQSGDSIIMMVIDGRGASAGVSTSMAADIMRYAGAWESVNLDGGGSSTLYTQALGVRNRCSDGNERAVGNSVYAVLEAPEDADVAEIQFMDWKKEVPYLGQYTPVIYGYNKYGKLVDTDCRDFTLDCVDELGSVTADGHTLIADGSGTYMLRALHAGGAVATIPVSVVNDAPARATLDSVLINSTMAWDVELVATVKGCDMPVSPAAFSWTSADASVASVTADGTLKGVSNGRTTITGTGHGNTINIDVIVEIPAASHHHIEATPDASQWTVSRTSVGTATLQANEDHSYGLDYKLSSTRGPKVTLARKIAMWSHPEAVEVQLAPGNATVTGLTLNLRANNADRPVALTAAEVSNEAKTYTFDIAGQLEHDNIATYPVEFTSLAIGVGGNTTTNYHLDLPSIKARYAQGTYEGVDDASLDQSRGCPFAVEPGRVTIPGGASSVTVHDMAGAQICSAAKVSSVSLPAGVYVISAVIGDTLHTAKIKIDNE